MTVTAALFAVGGLIAVIATVCAIVVTQLDRRGGVTGWGYFAIPGLVLVCLFVAAAWRA